METDRWKGADRGCSRHARIRLTDPVTVAPGQPPAAALESSDFDDLDPASCMRYPTAVCDGSVTSPSLRADGLEMFFAGDYPCWDWHDYELFVAFRPDTRSPWSAPVFLSNLSTFRPSIEAPKVGHFVTLSIVRVH
jgi:hypothetical protein